MIAIPFAVMLAAACLLVAMSGMLRQFAGQPAPRPARATGRHCRPRSGVEVRTTFGWSSPLSGREWRQFRYHTIGGAS